MKPKQLGRDKREDTHLIFMSRLHFSRIGSYFIRCGTWGQGMPFATWIRLALSQKQLPMSRFFLGSGSCGTSYLTVDEDDASIDASNASLFSPVSTFLNRLCRSSLSALSIVMGQLAYFKCHDWSVSNPSPLWTGRQAGPLAPRSCLPLSTWFFITGPHRSQGTPAWSNLSSLSELLFPPQSCRAPIFGGQVAILSFSDQWVASCSSSFSHLLWPPFSLFLGANSEGSHLCLAKLAGLSYFLSHIVHSFLGKQELMLIHMQVPAHIRIST